MPHATMGRVVPFERTAAELCALAAKQQDSGHPLTALTLLRLGLEKSPNDPAIRLAMARVYASMHCYTQSNAILFSLLQNQAADSPCFYVMGENFMHMRLHTLARDCFVMALQEDPDAEHTPQAVSYLDQLDVLVARPTPFARSVRQRIARVVHAMESDKPQLAARLTRRVLAIAGDSAPLHALRAFVLLNCKNIGAAIASARKAYRMDAEDLHSLCAMAATHAAVHANAASQRYLQRAIASIDTLEDAYLVCRTACETGAHDSVLSLLLDLQSQMPYSDEILHLLATAYHNMGNREEAARRWRVLQQIDPTDTTASFRSQGAAQDTLPALLPYSRRQIPLREMLRRLQTLRQWVGEGQAAMQARWHADSTFTGLLQWGLYCEDPTIAQAMCGILSTLHGEAPQAMLRGLLGDVNAGRALQHSALIALAAMGAEGPFYMVAGERLTLVHVTKNVQPKNTRLSRETAILLCYLRRWMRTANERETEAMRALCTLTLTLPSSLSLTLKARATLLAHCALTGERPPPAAGHPRHRTVERLARRIMKEAQHAMHQF